MTTQKIIVFLLLSHFSASAFSQGHIDYIKNQDYLKLKGTIDCANSNGDNLSERICANLAFQRSDSLLSLVYDSLIISAKELDIDSAETRIITLQTTWRNFRDQHCALVYDSYKDCGGCHQQAIDYLNCLRELTEERIKELIRLKKQLIE